MVIPLSVVIAISMIKDAWEDHQRSAADRAENGQAARVYSAGAGDFSGVKWMDLRVGQVVELRDGEFAPADIALIHSTGQGNQGLVYVETKNLDGETNLKIKQVPKGIGSAFNRVEDLQNLNGHLTSELPNEHLYKFEGKIEMNDPNSRSRGQPAPLGPDNIILRGSCLRNTEKVYGVIVFTGQETKIMQNSTSAKYKFSKLEKLANVCILVILVFQILMSAIGALIGTVWISENGFEETNKELCQHFLNFQCSRAYYLDLESQSMPSFLKFLQIFGTWILIFTNFVPISLFTTLEVVKLFQASFMTYDACMIDEEECERMRAQASNLNEELGQVEYVFSDKTGTLTCNVMEFRQFSAGTESYGTDEGAPRESQEQNVNFDDPLMYETLDNPQSEKHNALRAVVLFMATCHSIIIDHKKGRYNSASPDELALVNAAKQFGYEYKERDAEDNIIIHDRRRGCDLKY